MHNFLDSFIAEDNYSKKKLYQKSYAYEDMNI